MLTLFYIYLHSFTFISDQLQCLGCKIVELDQPGGQQYQKSGILESQRSSGVHWYVGEPGIGACFGQFFWIFSSAGSRLFALILGFLLLSAALWSSRLLWLWKWQITSPLSEFYLTSWIAWNMEKLKIGPVSCGNQSQRRWDDWIAVLRRLNPVGEARTGGSTIW